MVKKRGAAPATKDDLEGILQGLIRLDSKIDEVHVSLRTELKGDISSLRTEVKGDIRLLMIESVDTNTRMKSMEERLTAKMDAGRAEDAALRESFLGRMETLWRESAVFPKLLDEHAAALRGHESRIAALEARPAP